MQPSPASAHAIPENDHDAAQMLGNILNQGNATATLPEDRKSSKKSSGKSSTSKPEADDFSMSSKRQFKAKKKAGQRTQIG